MLLETAKVFFFFQDLPCFNRICPTRAPSLLEPSDISNILAFPRKINLAFRINPAVRAVDPGSIYTPFVLEIVVVSTAFATEARDVAV